MHFALAILAGYLVMAVIVIILTIVVAKAMGLPMGDEKSTKKKKETPPKTYIFINLVYGWIAVVIGAYVTAILSNNGEASANVVWLGVFMTIMSSTILFSGDNQPTWYKILLVVTPLPLTVCLATIY